MTIRLVVAAAAALSLTGTAALAETPPTQSVSLVGVDFKNPADVAKFYSQLRAAAAAVCDTNSANPRITQADQACAAKVLQRTVAALDRSVPGFGATAPAEASRPVARGE
ncbi:MAG: UrcA family protein [Caulobacterales bacterium]|nr:UrcA family protein [Caulobacterales bacterium]